MSSSDAQPPLSRRQARERERAAAAGSQPATPPPTVATPAAETPESRRRPGSHVAPAPGGPAQSSTPGSAQDAPGSAPSVPVSAPAAGVPPFPPASATEIVPGSGGLTRRQIRQLRAAERQAVLPVPLQNPTPQSSDRTVEDVIGSVDTIDPAAAQQSTPDAEAERDEQSAAPTVLDQAAVAQATEADGSPDAIEALDEAAAHAEEPRRHRSTWSPPADSDSDGTHSDRTESDATDSDATDPDATAPEGVGPRRPGGRRDRRCPGRRDARRRSGRVGRHRARVAARRHARPDPDERRSRDPRGVPALARRRGRRHERGPAARRRDRGPEGPRRVPAAHRAEAGDHGLRAARRPLVAAGARLERLRGARRRDRHPPRRRDEHQRDHPAELGPGRPGRVPSTRRAR
ncbi:hypothetical protein Q9Q99_19055 [Curtobacterium flaccumfaciens]|nr:hypothetical protein Q9Q99_19055 [Curtobacterium flaccumfaciens]